MANIDIEYKGNSFEENPMLITWIQLFIIRLLRSNENRTDWIGKFIQELEWNSKVEIYKYIFDDEILNSKEKEEWAISLLLIVEEKMNELSLQEFASFISEKISDKVDYKRIKDVVVKMRSLIESSMNN